MNPDGCSHQGSKTKSRNDDLGYACPLYHSFLEIAIRKE